MMNNKINASSPSRDHNQIEKQAKLSNQSIIKKLTNSMQTTYTTVYQSYLEKNIIKVGDIINKYQLDKLIGEGSFGKVFKATEIATKKEVAIKMCKFTKKDDEYSLAADRERYFLELLKENPYVVNAIEYFRYMNNKCIVTELLGSNLYEMSVQNKYMGFSLNIIITICKQLLQFLNTIRKTEVFEGLIHCDLKPENILLSDDENNQIKIIDFGLSYIDGEKTSIYTQSRFYRAPEVLLGLDFGNPIDMWSVGCILVELYTGKSLFPGENSDDQLELICSIIGDIPKEMMEKRKPIMNINNQDSIPQIKKLYKKNTLKNILSVKDDYNKDFEDLITQMLQIDPKLRITPDMALKHKLFKISGNKRKLDSEQLEQSEKSEQLEQTEK